MGTLSRVKILVTAAPATSKQTKATRVIDFVTQFSVFPAERRTLPKTGS
jgi:hypothetical protein